MSGGEPVDAAVIGAGFAGISAALQLARARRTVLLVDDHRPRNRFAAASHGFFGQDGRSPAAIRGEALAQLLAYPTVEWLQARATGVRAADPALFRLQLADGGERVARRLVLASGVADRLPDLPGLEARWGVSVLHCPYCDGYELRDRRLGVLARSALSANMAALLPDWGPTTYFANGFDPDAGQARLLEVRGVAVERAPVTALVGDAPQLGAVRLADGREVAIDALFVPARVEMASPLAEQLGCAFEEGPAGAYLRVDEWQQTNVAGVYAAGDAASAVHNAMFAAADGARAGFGAHRSLVQELSANRHPGEGRGPDLVAGSR